MPAAALAATLLLAALPAQDPDREPAKAPEKLADWPAVTSKVDREVRNQVKQFGKDGDDLHRAAHQKLVEVGAGIAPILIPMVNDRPKNVNAHIFAALDATCDARHSALLAREAGRPSVEWRRYLMRRLGSFHEEELRPVLAKGLADKDPEIRFQAALGMLGTGSDDGLEVVLEAARQRWSEVRPQLDATLTPVRSATTAGKVLAHIAKQKPTEQMAGLRVLRFLMDKKQAPMLRHYLNSSDFAVKREAINCARVVHGEEAMEKLSSFQAINLAKQWLEKL